MIVFHNPKIKAAGTNAQGVALRPTPFISISSTPIKNKIGTFGSDYTITLNGTILPHKGSPFFTFSSPSSAMDKYEYLNPNLDKEQVVSDKAGAILAKQNAIRELFAYDGMKLEIFQNYDIAINPNPLIVTNVTVESINFEEGTYADKCNYTIVLKATHLKDHLGNLYRDSLFNIYENTASPTGEFSDISNLNTSINGVYFKYGGFVETYTDEWSFEVDESLGETSDTDAFTYIPRTYIITRNTSATGRTMYDGDRKREAWENAKNFLIRSVLSETIPETVLSRWRTADDYPDHADTGSDTTGGTQETGYNFADVVVNLAEIYGGYNHSRTENINKTDGIVSITDRYVLLQTKAFENYDVSIESSNSEPFTTFNINGSIKGVSEHSALSSLYGGTSKELYSNGVPKNNADQNAVLKYKKVSNSGKFDINSFVFKRVAAITNLSLNPQPLSISVSRNSFTGEITYAVSYNNRPLNIISEALNEQISVQDTYPGDLYSIIPVIGRPTGPVLQYIGGRTEYRRSISINLQFDYTDIDRYTPAIPLLPPNRAAELINTRKSLLMSKPTLIEPIRSQINNLVRSLSPLNEPNIRKCFVDPPSESWEPRTGSYSLNISWVYELSDEYLPQETQNG